MSMGTLALALCGMILMLVFLIQIPTGMTLPDSRDWGYFYRVLQEAINNIEIVKAHVFSNPTGLR